MNRALLVGINAYPTTPLRGCVNDITDMAKFLSEKCGFAMDDIRLLVDARATKHAIVERLLWLTKGLAAGDRVVFHYSGHGVQLPTRSPQGEVDGLDEAICPVDFDWSEAHTIRDKEFETIFEKIPAGVDFVWISDSCHSGDLQREMIKQNSRDKTIDPPVDIDWRLQTAKQKNMVSTKITTTANNLNLVLISGCKSNQTSADALINKRYNGALTYYLLAELNKKNGLKVPLTDVLHAVTASLKKNKYKQLPQLQGLKLFITAPFLPLVK